MAAALEHAYCTPRPDEKHDARDLLAQTAGTTLEGMQQLSGVVDKPYQPAAAYPETEANSDVYVALAMAGQARIALEAGEHARALDLLEQSFTREPGTAGTQDGLWLSGGATRRSAVLA